NRPYYPEYLERLDYRKDVDWIEFRVKTPDEIPEKVMRVQELVGKRTGIRLNEWKSKKELVSKYADQLFELLDEAYAHLYGTTPLTREQVAFYIKTYLGFVDPRFTKVLVDSEDRLIGFCITMPSLSRALQKAGGRLFPFGWFHLLRALKRNDEVDMYLVAVKKEYQARGAIAFMMTALINCALREGIKYAETNPELETNVEVHSIWKDLEKRQHKRRRVYVKQL
ncbi:MAG: GNAT family N-acetyltransferase, partial [Spirochaetaceae bacterium]|nr:GNAT family N-acetyltransferase [Spirochaetaceae bacterium]